LQILLVNKSCLKKAFGSYPKAFFYFKTFELIKKCPFY
jgi:hypothetical protein